MGIHISCDSCYRSIKDGEWYKHYILVEKDSKRADQQDMSFIVCQNCRSDKEYFHHSFKNPNYIPKPEPIAEPEGGGEDGKH